MARIKLPSYLKEGHGRMEDAVLVTKQGVSYMMPYKKYDRGNTASQAEIKNTFKTVAADWKYLEGIISDAWSLPTRGTIVTGYNNFMAANFQHRRAGEPLLLCIGMGEELLVNFTAAPGTTAGTITCTFLPPEAGCHVTFFTRLVTAPGVKSPVDRHDAGADPVSPFTITGLEPGMQYHVYAIVTDAQYDTAKTISQSAAATSNAG